jgi:4-methyl-5(b-hydroxyethyl)-thiazole monophosphate biosynthesis
MSEFSDKLQGGAGLAPEPEEDTTVCVASSVEDAGGDCLMDRSMNDGTKILLVLVDGFEDLEAVAILDVFGWTAYREHIPKATVVTCGLRDPVRSRFGLVVKPHRLLEEVDPSAYRALVLPGGFHGYGYEEAYDAGIHRLAREIHGNGGYIATMCVGILPIADAGLLGGKMAVTYPYSRNHDNIGRLKGCGAIIRSERVVMDDRIISCAGPGSSLDVAFLLMECLLGPEAAGEVRKYMIYERP